jgi:hypothetical protein
MSRKEEWSETLEEELDNVMIDNHIEAYLIQLHRRRDKDGV